MTMASMACAGARRTWMIDRSSYGMKFVPKKRGKVDGKRCSEHGTDAPNELNKRRHDIEYVGGAGGARGASGIRGMYRAGVARQRVW